MRYQHRDRDVCKFTCWPQRFRSQVAIAERKLSSAIEIFYDASTLFRESGFPSLGGIDEKKTPRQFPPSALAQAFHPDWKCYCCSTMVTWFTCPKNT